MRWFTLQFDFASDDTTKTVNFPSLAESRSICPQGVCRLQKYKMADFSEEPTFTCDVYDSEDKIFTKASIADAGVTIGTDVIPIVPGGRCVLTSTGSPGEALSCFITFFVFDI